MSSWTPLDTMLGPLTAKLSNMLVILGCQSLVTKIGKFSFSKNLMYRIRIGDLVPLLDAHSTTETKISLDVNHQKGLFCF